MVRLLTPDDYGLVAMAGVLLGLVAFLFDGGISTAIVSRGERDPARLSQLAGATLVLGVAFAALSAALAWPLARFFNEPRLIPVVLVVSSSYLYLNLKTVPMASLQRDLRFREVAWAHFSFVLFGAAASLGLALAGMGYWALVLGNLAGASVSALITWRLAPQGLNWPVWATISDTVRFGGHVLVSRLAGYATETMDSIILGRRLGNAPLGNYRLAVELGSAPVEKISSIMLQVATPLLASVKSDVPALRRYFLGITEALAMVGWPLAVGLALVADLAVDLVLGDQWLNAAAPLKVLALLSAWRCTSPLFASLAFARGNSRILARVSLVQVAVLVPALIIGTRYGLVGVAVAWVTVFVAASMLVLRWVLRDLSVSPLAYLAALRPAAVSTACMTGVVLVLPAILPVTTSRWVELLTAIALGGGTYTAVLVTAYGDRVRRVIGFVRPGRVA